MILRKKITSQMTHPLPYPLDHTPSPLDHTPPQPPYLSSHCVHSSHDHTPSLPQMTTTHPSLWIALPHHPQTTSLLQDHTPFPTHTYLGNFESWCLRIADRPLQAVHVNSTSSGRKYTSNRSCRLACSCGRTRTLRGGAVGCGWVEVMTQLGTCSHFPYSPFG